MQCVVVSGNTKTCTRASVGLPFFVELVLCAPARANVLSRVPFLTRKLLRQKGLKKGPTQLPHRCFHNQKAENQGADVVPFLAKENWLGGGEGALPRMYENVFWLARLRMHIIILLKNNFQLPAFCHAVLAWPLLAEGNTKGSGIAKNELNGIINGRLENEKVAGDSFSGVVTTTPFSNKALGVESDNNAALPVLFGFITKLPLRLCVEVAHGDWEAIGCHCSQL